MQEAQSHPDPIDSDASRRTQQNSTHSPFQVVVADILIEIFSQALLANDDDKPRFTPHNWNKSAPMNVAAVCRHWRTIALSSPSLWSVFRSYNVDGWSDFPWEELNMFLLRSKQAPLDLFIDIWRARSKDYDELSSLVVNNQTRFRSIDIKWNAYGFFHGIPILSNLPALETLRLSFNMGLRRSSVHIHLAHAPLLRQLSLTGSLALHLDGEFVFNKLVDVSLSQHLQVFEAGDKSLHDLSWHDCLMIIQASPSLKEFIAADVKLLSGGTYFNSAAEISCTTLPDLALLTLGSTLGSTCHEAVRHISENVCLPALKELTLTLDLLGGEQSACGLYALLSRSKAAVESLALSGCNTAEIMQCLECVPTLRILTIARDNFDSPEFCNLIVRLTMGSGTHICPKLESITFLNCGDPSACFRELTSMICSRWDRLTVGDERCLKTVTFNDLKWSWDFPYSEELLRCRMEGLDIQERKPVHNEANDWDGYDRGDPDYGYGGTGSDDSLEAYFAVCGSD